MDSSNPTIKTHFERINLNCIILVCYLISTFTNISFFFIFILSKYLYKWIGLLIILLEIIILQMSIDKIKILKQKNFQGFKDISLALMFILIFNFLLFIGITIYIISNKVEPDLILVFIFCCVIWCLFHILFILILRYYITNKKFMKKKEVLKEMTEINN